MEQSKSRSSIKSRGKGSQKSEPLIRSRASSRSCGRGAVQQTLSVTQSHANVRSSGKGATQQVIPSAELSTSTKPSHVQPHPGVKRDRSEIEALVLGLSEDYHVRQAATQSMVMNLPEPIEIVALFQTKTSLTTIDRPKWHWVLLALSTAILAGILMKVAFGKSE